MENNFKNIADVFLTMSDNFNNIPPLTLYFLGASLYQDNQTDIGCNVLKTLSSQRIFAFDTLFTDCILNIPFDFKKRNKPIVLTMAKLLHDKELIFTHSWKRWLNIRNIAK